MMINMVSQKNGKEQKYLHPSPLKKYFLIWRVPWLPKDYLYVYSVIEKRVKHLCRKRMLVVWINHTASDTRQVCGRPTCILTCLTLTLYCTKHLLTCCLAHCLLQLYQETEPTHKHECDSSLLPSDLSLEAGSKHYSVFIRWTVL
jgi:hypothetical protein